MLNTTSFSPTFISPELSERQGLNEMLSFSGKQLEKEDKA